MTMWAFQALILGYLAGMCYGGECCKAYYDLTFDYNDEKWCDNYCCGTSALGALECCDSFLLQAPDSDIKSFCLDFFAKNIWAPILIALGCLGVLITCVACCYCCLHSSTTSGRVVAPVPAHQPYHTNVMLLNPMTTQPPGYNPMATQAPGYNPQAGPYPVQPVPSGVQPAENQQTDSKHPFET